MHARAQRGMLAPQREELLVELLVGALIERLLVRGEDVDGAGELGHLAGIVGVPNAEIRRDGPDRQLLHSRHGGG